MPALVLSPFTIWFTYSVFRSALTRWLYCLVPLIPQSCAWREKREVAPKDPIGIRGLGSASLLFSHFHIAGQRRLQCCSQFFSSY